MVAMYNSGKWETNSVFKSPERGWRHKPEEFFINDSSGNCRVLQLLFTQIIVSNIIKITFKFQYVRKAGVQNCMISLFTTQGVQSSMVSLTRVLMLTAGVHNSIWSLNLVLKLTAGEQSSMESLTLVLMFKAGVHNSM